MSMIQGLLRPTPFRVGLLAGAGVFLALAGLSYGASRLVLGPRVEHNVQAVAAGAALTRVGARKLEVRTTHGLIMRQVCNGACDDLTYGAESGDNSYELAVLDAKGGCIACDAGIYVDGLMNSVARLEFRDGPAPRLQAAYYYPQPDGSLKLQRAPED